MLHRLEIENFYSIRDAQVIDLRADRHAPDNADRLAPLWKGATERAPKVVALFGPNASGKSNVLRALSFVAWFVRDSFSLPPDARLPFERFNDAEAQEAPTSFALHLSGLEDVEQAQDPEARQCRYAYELTIGGGTAHAVQHEALYYWPSTAARRVRLFARGADGRVTAAKAFGLAGYGQALDKVLRPNASVIATLAQLKHPYSTLIRDAAARFRANILVERYESPEPDIVGLYADDPTLIERLNREIERIDFGIEALEIRQGPNGPSMLFRHHGLEHPMPLVYESHGTRQFLRFYPLLLQVLAQGGVVVLDELDTAIHPLLLPEILRWFRDPERNPHDAQLWMSCHNASLLEDLSKEEVLFCEKDGRGRTTVYGLRDIQAVRRGDNHYKKYLGGVYGAVPQIG